MIYKSRKVTFRRIINGTKQKVGNLFFKQLFPFWQYLGFHIIRNHFYEPIPDTRTLGDGLWEHHSELIGVNLNEEKQLKLLSDLASKYKSEYNNFPINFCKTMEPYDFYIENNMFSPIDAEILYCMVRDFKPRQIMEIGSGYSTYLSAKAILKNKEEDHCHESYLIAIEPYPNDILKNGFPGLSRLIPEKVENVPLSEFKKLKEDDILFVDSSHVLKIDSDVQYIYLEILPRLNKGVMVHCHDIFFPAEYPREWILKDHRFWNEQYVLQAFLNFNNSFEVIWASNYMNLKHPNELENVFNSYHSVYKMPSSFWMRKIK